MAVGRTVSMDNKMVTPGSQTVILDAGGYPEIFKILFPPIASVVDGEIVIA